MRTFVDGALTVTVPDYGVWLQEKNVLRAQGEAGHVFGLLYRDHGAEYTLDSDGKVEVDLSDVLRTYPLDDTHRFFCEYDGEQTEIAFGFSRAGLINPEHMLIPHDETLSKILAFDANELEILNGVLYVVPPTRMLQSDGNVQVAFELSFISQEAEHDYALEMSALAGGRWSDVGVGQRVVLPSNAVRYRLYEDYVGSFLMDRGLQEMECGKTYACVRWVSATGVERVHVWEVAKRKTETAGAYSLLTQDGSYDVAKGREDGFSLRLADLNAYDLWYYSDVCHSCKVEVSFDGFSWQRVDVVTNSTSVPDGDAGAFSVLEVELKYRKYDAIAL